MQKTKKITNNKYLNEILSLPPDNPFKLKLFSTAVDCCLKDLSDSETQLLINPIINDFYFEIVMPRENSAIEAERNRVLNNVPDFSDVYINQVWTGRNREADFIKALKLKPKPSGKNSRKAQVKSILQSCAFTDDKNTQTLTLTEIYPQRRESKRKQRTGKYAPYLELILIEVLKSEENRTIKISKPNLLKKLKVIPFAYKKLEPEFYEFVLKKELCLSKETVKEDLNHFHKIADERFKDIIEPVLDNLTQKSVIKYQSYPVVVTKEENGQIKYTSIFNSEELGLKIGELAQMMLKAEQWAAQQIEVDFYDEVQRKVIKKHLKNRGEVIKYWKLPIYKNYYDSYIQNEYGWLYTFEEIEIVLTDNSVYLDEVIKDTKQAVVDLNKLVVDAVKKTIKTKYCNNFKKYEMKSDALYKVYENSADIADLMELGIYSYEDIKSEIDKKLSSLFLYSSDFIERTDTFIKYELSLDKAAIRSTNKWLFENKAKPQMIYPPNYSP